MDKKQFTQRGAAKTSLVELAQLVKQMRHNQRRYELFRKPEILETKLKLEKEVDDIINIITDTQKSIF